MRKPSHFIHFNATSTDHYVAPVGSDADDWIPSTRSARCRLVSRAVCFFSSSQLSGDSMKNLFPVSVAGALALGTVGAHASIAAPSSGSSDAVLFAEVVNAAGT